MIITLWAKLINSALPYSRTHVPAELDAPWRIDKRHKGDNVEPGPGSFPADAMTDPLQNPVLWVIFNQRLLPECYKPRPGGGPIGLPL
jgi:hypothetical protein